MNPVDDQCVLLQAARRGDEQALARLLAPHWCALKVFCGLMLGDADAADQALTETALAARSEVAAVESSVAVRMWIHRIAVRVCVQAIGDCPTGEDDQPPELMTHE
jgi:DNA-directed RNA polymerase specialized sigma24 family protein